MRKQSCDALWSLRCPADTLDVAGSARANVLRPIFLRPTALTVAACCLSAAAIVGTAAYLAWSYSGLPDLLPVHFRWDGRANGWQIRTLPRVLIPVFVQFGLIVALGGVSLLLLFRDRGDPHDSTPDAGAARTAAEAVLLMATIWVVFQAYTGVALVRLWSSGSATLGRGYTALEVLCLVLTGIVGARAQRQLGRPSPLPYDAAHWRLGHLYCNADHPALFVPTRDGRRWTLNFGRPGAVVLLAGALAVGIVAPSAILLIALR